LGSVEAEDMLQALVKSLDKATQNGVQHFVNEYQTNFLVSIRPAGTYVKKRRDPYPKEREYLFWNHHLKGNMYLQALFRDGYRRSGNYAVAKKLDFIMTDQGVLARVHQLQDFYEVGTRRFFVYPHTSRPNLVADVVPEWEHITAQFVVSEEHAEVMRMYGYSKPLHAVGWSLCPIEKFRPRPEPRKVLFAPIHPRCAEIDKKANRETFKRLLKLARDDRIDLTVRYIKELSGAGLEFVQHPNVHYFQGDMGDYNSQIEQIDETDWVVSHQTFAWMAVARGTPTVMMAEDMPTHVQLMYQDTVEFAQNWDKYHHLIAYPLDILACKPKDVWKLLQRAASCDEEIRDWKRRMIGEMFDGEKFMKILEGYLG
jgi:hypothetical protein